ncbi:hypothetical protein HDU76_007086 [Blyttiomyces sp. JEL0837]|nr:hypothetical protein HDU76_007086 [Blyttiomyces sp. JEL0837]
MTYNLRSRSNAGSSSKSKEVEEPKAKQQAVISEIKKKGADVKKILKTVRKVDFKPASAVRASKDKITQVHSRLMKQIQSLAPLTPSEAKTKMATAELKSATVAQIAKRAVNQEVKSLGLGSPINRVAKTNVKRGLPLDLGISHASGAVKALRRRKSNLNLGSSDTLKKAVVGELSRFKGLKPSEAKGRVRAAEKYDLVKAQLLKDALVKEIKKSK